MSFQNQRKGRALTSNSPPRSASTQDEGKGRVIRPESIPRSSPTPNLDYSNHASQLHAGLILHESEFVRPQFANEDEHISEHQGHFQGQNIWHSGNNSTLALDNVSDNEDPKQVPHKSERQVSDDGLDIDGHPKGQVLYGKTDMYHRESDDAEWKPAIYHSEIRGALILAASHNGSYGDEYLPLRSLPALIVIDFTREAGDEANDVTSFFPPQKNWGLARPDRPSIVFEYKRGNRKDPTYPDNAIPLWFHEGRLVIDIDNHAVRRFQNIPDALSSKLEGCFMEAMGREDSRILHKDFRARMPRTILKGNKHVPAPTPNVLSQRRRRFREKAACISWNNRAGTETRNSYIENLLPAACKALNSTEDFRDLFDYELAELQNKNLGKFSERAGQRKGTTTETRQANQQKQRHKAKELRSKHDAEQRDKDTAVLAQRRQKRKFIEALSDEDEARTTRIGNTTLGPITSKRVKVSDAKPPTRHSRRQNSCDLEFRDYEFERSGRSETSCNHGRVRQIERIREGSPVEASRRIPYQTLRPENGADAAKLNASKKLGLTEAYYPGHQEAQAQQYEIEGGDQGIVIPVSNPPQEDSESEGPESGDSENGDSESEDIDPEDSTVAWPSTQEEMVALQDALAATRTHFAELTTRLPPLTDWNDNYVSQWGMMQIALNALWTVTDSQGDAPILTAVERWTGGITNWHTGHQINGINRDDILRFRRDNIPANL